MSRLFSFAFAFFFLGFAQNIREFNDADTVINQIIFSGYFFSLSLSFISIFFYLVSGGALILDKLHPSNENLYTNPHTHTHKQPCIWPNFGWCTDGSLFAWNAVHGFCDFGPCGKMDRRVEWWLTIGCLHQLDANQIHFIVSNFLSLFLSMLTQLGIWLAFIILPLYQKLGVTSSFEYLERRFDRRIRLLASFIYTLKYLLFIPFVIYVPALTFSQGSLMYLHHPRH